MSGLLALLDDIAAIAKLAAAQMDDIAAQTAKAGSKAAGVVIDDAAVTPKYVEGLPASREIPIVLKIAQGSLFNKLVILLPAALLLELFAPWLIAPLLVLGGAYLCFEGAEKILHLFMPHADDHDAAKPVDPEHLEKTRIAGAVKTDFILSAEIMTIALANIDADSVLVKGLVLAAVAAGITVFVYGAVAGLVKADDLGLRLAQKDQAQFTQRIGRWIVLAMPVVMKLIASIGTLAMLWVGGSIIIHSMKELGIKTLYKVIHNIAHGAAEAAPVAHGFTEWLVTATLDGIFGLIIGMLIIPLVVFVIAPAVSAITGNKAEAH